MQKEVEKYGTKLWAECSEFRFVDRDEVEGLKTACWMGDNSLSCSHEATYIATQSVSNG